MKEKMLKDLIINEKLLDAPVKTELFGKHYQFTIAIGKDEDRKSVV